MFGIDFGDGGLITFAVIYSGVIIVALWLAMIIWVYRDMRARSRDGISQLIFAVVVAVLTLPGLFIYLLLRPRETLSESYERSLEEEALLQEIEEKPTCPGCGQRVHDDWQACAYCHTRLKKACISCRHLLELSWNLCPHCASSQGEIALELPDYSQQQAQPQQRQSRQQRISVRRQDPASTSTESIEFVDTDDY